MKKIGKYLLVLGIFLIFGALKVNAETKYVGDKKYTFTEFEGEKALIGAFNYNDKTYAIAFDDLFGEVDENNIPIYTLEVGDKAKLVKVKDTEKIIKELEESASNIENVYYEFERGYLNDEGKNKFFKTTEKGSEVDKKEIDLDFLNVENTYVDYVDEINGNLYFYISGINEEKILVLNKKYEIIKTINREDLLKKVITDEDKEDGLYSSMYVATLVKDEEPYIMLRTEIYKEEKSKEVYYIFDMNGELLATIADDNNVMEISPIFKDKEVNFLYQACEYDEDDYEYTKCELKTINLKGKKTSISKATSYIQHQVTNGFIIVSNEKEKNTILYDNNLNLILTADFSSGSISSIRDLKNYINSDDQIYKEVQNGNYIVSLYDYTYDEKDEFRSMIYYLTVEDSIKTTITGVIKDKDGNPLKNHTVELHSTPRTVKTDENGYFKFESVEEGEHTLTIIDPDGNKLATKKINVIASDETRMDGDTLYFDGTGKGFDIELKVDGEKLFIERILNEPKENGVLAKLLNNEKVPKTADSIVLYIVMLIAFIGGGTLLRKKINKMN